MKDWGRLPSGVKYGYTHGVQIDSHNRVIVHNQSKDSVIIFDHKGKYIKSWGPEFQKGAHGCLLRKENGDGVSLSFRLRAPRGGEDYAGRRDSVDAELAAGFRRLQERGGVQAHQRRGGARTATSTWPTATA